MAKKADSLDGKILALVGAIVIFPFLDIMSGPPVQKCGEIVYSIIREACKIDDYKTERAKGIIRVGRFPEYK